VNDPRKAGGRYWSKAWNTTYEVVSLDRTHKWSDGFVGIMEYRWVGSGQMTTFGWLEWEDGDRVLT
jgi:hypothetical protein